MLEGEFGLIPRSCAHILYAKFVGGSLPRDAVVSVSYVEIYQEVVYDLLNKGKKLKVVNGDCNNFKLLGESFREINCMKDVGKVLSEGHSMKQIFETQMNKQSSRSHCIFTIRVENHEEAENNSHGHKRTSSSGSSKSTKSTKPTILQLVDLAGSERWKKSKASGERFQEMRNINLSLSALERCIVRLTKAARPSYRDSALTKLLKPSLEGKTKMRMIICCSSEKTHAQETVSSLRFGERTTRIVRRLNKMIANVRARLTEITEEYNRKRMDPATKNRIKLSDWRYIVATKQLKDLEAKLRAASQHN